MVSPAFSPTLSVKQAVLPQQLVQRELPLLLKTVFSPSPPLTDLWLKAAICGDQGTGTVRCHKFKIISGYGYGASTFCSHPLYYLQWLYKTKAHFLIIFSIMARLSLPIEIIWHTNNSSEHLSLH